MDPFPNSKFSPRIIHSPNSKSYGSMGTTMISEPKCGEPTTSLEQQSFYEETKTRKTLYIINNFLGVKNKTKNPINLDHHQGSCCAQINQSWFSLNIKVLISYRNRPSMTTCAY